MPAATYGRTPLVDRAGGGLACDSRIALASISAATGNVTNALRLTTPAASPTSSVAEAAMHNRAADPRFTPHALGRVADLEPAMRAPVAGALVHHVSGAWLPGRAEVRALRTIPR